ncbi:MAG: TonB family protein [Syntrophales bacterium]
MMTKKFLILFVLASLAGHALVLALTTQIDWTVETLPEDTQKVITVEIKMLPPDRPAQRLPRRPVARQQAAVSGGFREGTANLQGEASPYRDYLLQVRRKIEQLWNYPSEAVEAQEEGNVVIRFTIEANGGLAEFHVLTPSGSAILDEGTLAVIKAAAPYAPLPAEYNLSRLHITATFSYRMGG